MGKCCSIQALLLCQQNRTSFVNHTQPISVTVINSFTLSGFLPLFPRVEFKCFLVVTVIFGMFTVQLRLKVYTWPWRWQLRKQSQTEVRLVAVLVRSVISQDLHQQNVLFFFWHLSDGVIFLSRTVSVTAEVHSQSCEQQPRKQFPQQMMTDQLQNNHWMVLVILAIV